MAATSFATPMHGLANEQEISLSSNNIRDNRARGFLSASEDPRGSLLPTAVVGERQRIWARLVSAPSRSSWGVARSESTCRRVAGRLLSRAQWRWRVGRLNAGLGPAQTASSWPSTAPPPAVSCALLDLHGNENPAPARSSSHSGPLPPAVIPAVDVVDRVLFLPPLADSATDESGRQAGAPAVRHAGLRRHRVLIGRA